MLPLGPSKQALEARRAMTALSEANRNTHQYVLVTNYLEGEQPNLYLTPDDHPFSLTIDLEQALALYPFSEAVEHRKRFEKTGTHAIINRLRWSDDLQRWVFAP